MDDEVKQDQNCYLMSKCYALMKMLWGNVINFSIAAKFNNYIFTWLWSGNGIIEAQTPSIMEGWISQCVYVEQ